MEALMYEFWPWEVAEYAQWTWIIAVYLALGGMGAGSYVTAAVADIFGKEKYQDIMKSGTVISPIVLSIGAALLLLDLGDPIEGMKFRFINPTSWMTYGAWALLFLIILGAIYAFLWITGKSRKLRMIVAIPGIFIGVFVGVYTGLLLSALQFIPLWNTPLLPALFTVSAMSTGMAATMFLPLLKRDIAEKIKIINKYDIVKKILAIDQPEDAKEEMEITHKISIADDVLVVLELFVLMTFINFVSKTNIYGLTSIEAMLSGHYALYFWGGVVGIGLVIPFLLSFVSLFLAKTSKTVPLLEFACIAFGGLVLRFVIVYAAVKQPPFFPTIL